MTVRKLFDRIDRTIASLDTIKKNLLADRAEILASCKEEYDFQTGGEREDEIAGVIPCQPKQTRRAA
jgi:hypothetical protein